MSGVVTLQQGASRYLRIPREEIRKVTVNVHTIASATRDGPPNTNLRRLEITLTGISAPLSMLWQADALVVVGDRQVCAYETLFADLLDTVEIDIRWEALDVGARDLLRWKRTEHRR